MEKSKFTALLISIFLGIILCQAISENIIFIATVEGRSMSLTFNSTDKVLVYKTQEVSKGDIIVSKEPITNKKIIKRCIATPGDIVQITDSIVYVNGNPIEDNYSKGETCGGCAESEISLNKDEYFILGDNRENSKDSRYFGVIKKNTIIGKVLIKEELK